MRVLPSHLRDVIASDAMTLATCWRLTLESGAVLRFTDHHDDVVIGAERFAAGGSFSRSSVEYGLGLADDNLELTGSVGDDSITDTDLIAGRYDYATVQVFLVDRDAPSGGIFELCAGEFGEIECSDGGFSTTLYGMASALQQADVELCSPTCRAKVGDERCKVDLTAHTWTGAISAAVASMALSTTLVLPLDVLAGGVLTFTSGANAGLELEIKSNDVAGGMALYLPAPYPVAVADTFSVTRGCDGSLATCHDVYNNVINMRAEPFTPGSDKILQVTNAKPSEVV